MTLAQTGGGFIDRLAGRLPKAKRRRFLNGVEALSRKRFVSLNAAGRGLAANQATGLSRIGRLVADEDLARKLQEALVDHHLGNHAGRVWLNIDHSCFGDFTVCAIAVQTGRGRAVPVWFQINRGQRNAAIRPLLLALEDLANYLAANPRLRPVLVGDRWFASANLINFCRRAGWDFLFRTKADKIVDTPFGVVAIDDISDYDSQVEYKGRSLRLILSELRPGMSRPWWLLTNLDINRKKLLGRYAKCWEVESTFRDMKHVQNLKGLRLRKAGSLRNLLLFTSLSWAYLAPFAAEIPQVHPKKTLSWFHYSFERITKIWPGSAPDPPPA